MALNDSFLNSISDALVGKSAVPLDTLVSKFGEIVAGTEKNARTLQNLLGDMHQAFAKVFSHISGTTVTKDWVKAQLSSSAGPRLTSNLPTHTIDQSSLLIKAFGRILEPLTNEIAQFRRELIKQNASPSLKQRGIIDPNRGREEVRQYAVDRENDRIARVRAQKQQARLEFLERKAEARESQQAYERQKISGTTSLASAIAATGLRSSIESEQEPRLARPRRLRMDSGQRLLESQPGLSQANRDLRREAFIRRQSRAHDEREEIQGKIEEVLKSSIPALRKGLVETARSGKVLITDIEATNLHTVELTASLYEYDKETGELGRAIDSYTATMRYGRMRLGTAKRLDEARISGAGIVSRGGKHYPMPSDLRWLGNKGLNLAELNDSPGISQTRLRYMASKADLAVAHWPAADLQRLRKVVPGIESAVPWADSSTQIPWKRPLGFPAAGLQKLLGFHGLSTPGTAHRSEADVGSEAALLSSRHPQSVGGGRTYMKMMLGNIIGPSSVMEQFVSLPVEDARNRLEHIDRKLKSGRSHYVETLDAVLPEDEGRVTAKGKHDPAQESLPPTMGMGALALDAEKRSLEEFLRNALIVPAREIAQVYTKHAEILAAQAAEPTLGLDRGSGNREMGPDIALATLRRVNDEMDMQRPVSSRFRLGMMPLLPGVISGRESPIEAQLTQSYTVRKDARAKQLLDFANQEAILRSQDTSLQVGAVITDASGKVVGAGANRFPRGTSSTEIARLNLKENRGEKLGIVRHAEHEALTMAGAGAKGGTAYVNFMPCDACMAKLANAGVSRVVHAQLPEKYAGVAKSWQKYWDKAQGVADQAGISVMSVGPGGELPPFKTEEIERFIAMNRGKSNISNIQTAMQMARQLGPGHAKFLDLADIAGAGQLAGRTARNAAAATASRDAYTKLLAAPSVIGSERASAQQPMSEAKRKGFEYEAKRRASQRGFITADFLDFLNPFSKKGKEQQPPRDYRAEMRYDATYEKLKKLSDAIGATESSFKHLNEVIAPQKLADVAARRGHVSELASRRVEGINEAQKATESALGFGALEAQTSLEFAQERALKFAKKSKTGKVAGVMPSSPIERGEMIADVAGRMTALPGMKAAIAQFRASTAGLGLGEEEKISAARKLAAGQYVTARYGSGKGEDRKVPGKYTSAAAELQTQVEGLLGGFQTSRQQAGTKIGTIEADKEEALERLGAKEKKIDDDVAQAKVRSEKRVEDLKRAGRGTVEKYAKNEEMLAGRGGSSSGRGANGAGSGKSGIGAGAQSGYGFGMGFMALVAYDDAMKNLVKDMAIYSARTEMMEMATNQMAKTSGLNVSQVDAEVEAIKRLNVTTQVAHQTVQRFMMMQIDVAKAAKLVAVAQDLAAISGADAMETVSRLSQAVLTGYTRNLHMMGLQVTALGVMSDLKRSRKAEGKTGTPSMFEQRQALTNAILLEGAKVSGVKERSLSTAGGQFAYLRKEAQETMNVLGKEFLPTFTQVMASMTSGLKTIQGSAEGFADLAKALVSVGTAATIAGTAGFALQGVKALSAVNPWVLAATAAAGLLTYAYLDKDKSTSYKAVAGHQNAAFAERRKFLEAELAGAKPGSPLFISDTESLVSLKLQQRGANDDLKVKLAEDYNQRAKNLNYYIEAQEGKRGFGAEALSVLTGNPEDNIFEKIGAHVPDFLFSVSSGIDGPGDVGYDALGLTSYSRAKRSRAALFPSIAANSGLTPGSIARKAQEFRERESAKATVVGPTIVSEVNQKISEFMQAFQADEEALSSLDAALDINTGPIIRRARKQLGTPRQKAQIDREFLEKKLEMANADVVQFREYQGRGAAGKDPASQAIVEGILLRLGGGTPGEGEDAAAHHRELGREAMRKKAENYDKSHVVILEAQSDVNSNIAKQTDMRIAQIKEQTQVSRILGAVISGNYKSELEAIDKVLAKKKEDIKLGKTVKEDPDAAREARVAAEEEAQQSKDSLLKRFTSGIAEQERTESQYQAEVQARGIMEAPGADSLEATAQAYDARIAENEANELENNRKSSERRRLQHEKQDALHQIQLRRAGMAAQGNVTTFENAQRVAAAMAGSSEFDPMFGKRTELEQGKVSIGLRLSQGLDVAQYAYDQARSTPGVDMDEAERSRSQAAAAARTEAQESAIKFGGESRQSAGERLLDRYKQSLQIQEQIKQGMAMSEAEDRAATASMHELRLSNIADETAARLKGGMSVQAAERVAAQERLEEESGKLQEMLAARRKQADDVKSFGSEFFMTAVTDHARGLRNMLMGKIKGTGATMAGNALRSLIGTSPLMHLPNKMLVNSEGKPTKLGELLSGTRLGTPVASEKEVQEQLATVTNLNSAATRDNTTALDKLSEVAMSIMQHLGIAYTPAPGFSPSAGGSGYTLRSGGVPASWGGGGGAFSYTPVPMGLGGGAAAPGGEQVTSGISYDTEGVPPYIRPYDGSFAGSGGASAPEVPPYIHPYDGSFAGSGGASMSGGGVNAPADAAVAAQRLQQVLSTPGLAGAARATHTSGLLNMIKTVPGIMKLIPALKTLGGGKVPTVDLKTMEDLGVATPQGASIAAPGPVATAWQTAMSDVQGAAMIGTGAYQAATMMGKGARGDLFAAGGMAQAGAGAAQLFASELGPIAPGVQAGMEVASLVAEMLGSMFMDPKQKRSNQIANYLGMLQYMAPAQIAMTSSLAGNMVSEGKGGGATDTGIASTALKVTQPYMEQINPNPSFWSQPGAYLLGSNRPDVTQVPGLPSGMFPSADSLGGSQQYDYAGVPGQVLYNDLPGNAVPTNYGTMNVNISALDSKSVIDRAPDIAAAIQQQLRMGGSLAASLQSAVFGVG